jgi:hypothetical protein
METLWLDATIIIFSNSELLEVSKLYIAYPKIKISSAIAQLK